MSMRRYSHEEPWPHVEAGMVVSGPNGDRAELVCGSNPGFKLRYLESGKLSNRVWTTAQLKAAKCTLEINEND
jgi:hypothetical protein